MTLKIYMKSGNSIVLRGVKDYRAEYEGNEITALSILYKEFRFGEKLIVSTVALDQIEALSEI